LCFINLFLVVPRTEAHGRFISLQLYH
jgi:hypothetical protein